LVDEFLARYRRHYDWYHRAELLVAQELDANLASAGIRCIVRSGGCPASAPGTRRDGHRGGKMQPA
jgi:hypothetical protein